MNNLLDSIDRQILTVIQEDSRVQGIELAERVNLSKSAALQRLRRLEKEGYITNYEARLDPKKVGHGYLVYVQVKLSKTTHHALEEFHKAVRTVPAILSCDMLTAGFDYLLKVRCRDMEGFTKLHGEIISNLPGLKHTASFPVMKEVKDTNFLKIARP